MKKFSTYLLVIFMIMFWGLRIGITLANQLGGTLGGMVPINETFEIALLFAFLVCVILVAKRSLVGGLLYLALYAIYFGGDVTSKLSIIAHGETLTMAQNLEFMVSMIGIILPVAVLLDLLMDKNRKLNPKDKKTDWFYQNEEYDRKLDDRADKNNYRTM